MLSRVHRVASRALSATARTAGARALATKAAGESEIFATAEEHRRFLETQAALPKGFRVGKHQFEFVPAELPTSRAKMTLTVIAPEEPTPSFGAMFTSNAFPGHPVRVGRRRLAAPTLGAIVVNNKVSNVGAPGGELDSENLCEEVARHLGLASKEMVIPCSTGVIGWKLPIKDMIPSVPKTVGVLQSASILPAAEGIMTTDLYPKVRSLPVGTSGARVVGIAKGAGMVEPNMATMLVYLLTDAVVEREALRAALRAATDKTFNCISIDSDQSTSDTIVLASSNKVSLPAGTGLGAFSEALEGVCRSLAMDIVRNGEGVQHVMKVSVKGAPTQALARAVGKSIVNSPLFKSAVTGNDPNVGRLVAAIGKCVGVHPDGTPAGFPLTGLRIHFGGSLIFDKSEFRLGPEAEQAVHNHMKRAHLWESVPRLTAPPTPVQVKAGDASKAPPAWFVKGENVIYKTPIHYPPHQRCVEIDVDLGGGKEDAVVFGSDLTHEYVAVNADYRS